MKKMIKKGIIPIVMGVILMGCSTNQEQNISDLLKEKSKQDEVINLMLEDHEMMSNLIEKMNDEPHSQAMMRQNKEMMLKMFQNMKLVEEVFRENPASFRVLLTVMDDAIKKDTVFEKELVEVINEEPEVALMIVHHMLPIIEAHEHLSDSLCNELMEHKGISTTMCEKMKSNKKMSCH
ncbi:MAG: hypothetical protein P1U44_03055 [Vicingaceae bacterium]|nr:hypothetical protein [Flavobacteriales bacterium]MDF1674670.1 hypothetical protein [Vicingaceae bacterium]